MEKEESQRMHAIHGEPWSNKVKIINISPNKVKVGQRTMIRHGNQSWDTFVVSKNEGVLYRCNIGPRYQSTSPFPMQLWAQNAA